ncbi:MAG: rhomboid family intramembrane serine protease [Actinomycetota bacterium]|nr:rhomboid family intramembrane serine protease [Actinomycetota bacterium]
MIPIKDNIPTDHFPFVTVTLILINVIVYLLSIRHGGSLISGPAPGEVVRYGATPHALTHPAQNPLPTFSTVLSSMFVHGSILHIAGNMLFLWIFGNNVEDSMGPVRFLAFYVLGGAAALALQVAVEPSSTAPTVGASGAVAAVLGGYILLYPRARVLTLVFIILFFTVIELPAIVMLGIWFAEQAVFGAADLTNPNGGGGGVAYFAHVGGFAFGLLAIHALATRRKQIPPRLPVY